MESEARPNPYLPRRAEVVALREETPDVKTYVLKSAAPVSFVPGQFHMVSLPGYGEAAISLSSDPEEGKEGLFWHTVRAVGSLTKALARLEVGDWVWVRGPFGRGWPLEGGPRGLVVVAGGIGIAPLRPVIRSWLAARRGEIEVIYGARTPFDLVFRGEFSSWEEQGARLLLTVDRVAPGVTWPHHVGFVTSLCERLSLGPGEARVFICGPEAMMGSVFRVLAEKGWPRGDIFVSLERRMECGLATCGRCQFDAFYVCRDGPVFSCGELEKALGARLFGGRP